MKAYEMILFTHDDMDGIGCRVIFETMISIIHPGWLKGKEYNVFHCTNAGVNDTVRDTVEGNDMITKDTAVWFSDITASRETLHWLQDDKGLTVSVYDHHVTNYFVEHEIREPGETRIIVNNAFGKMESGTSILYQKLCEHPAFKSPNNGQLIEEFVENVRSYDTYEWKETGEILPKRLQTLFTMLGQEAFAKMFTGRFTDTADSGPLIPPYADIFIDARLDKEKRVIKKFSIDDTIITSVRGYLTAVIVKDVYANFSELASVFLKKYPHIDVIAKVSLFNGGNVEFRTAKDTINTGETIALPLGGGGHAKASGAPFSEELKIHLTNIFVHALNGYGIDDIKFR